MKYPYGLGDWIFVNSVLRRGGGHADGGGERKWEEEAYPTLRKVMVIGVRSLADGVVQVEGDSYEGYSRNFIPQRRFPALLVVENIYQAPFLVPMKLDYQRAATAVNIIPGGPIKRCTCAGSIEREYCPVHDA